jgi:mono/diheme cytochrome c family protein
MQELIVCFILFLALIAIVPKRSSKFGRVVALAAALAIIGCSFNSRVAAQEVGREKAKTLYQQFCQRCHESNGKGGGIMDVPDFTRRSWHDQKSNTQLVVSILEGKGANMPAFRSKLDEARAKELVSFIRAFVPTNSERPAEAGMGGEFDKQLQQLQEELQELKRQFKALDTTGIPASSPMALAGKTGRRENSNEPRNGDAAALYRRRCQRCHGKDRSGVAGKLDVTNPPDFSSPKWHAERTDAQLVTAILNGKGTIMPAFGKRFSDEEATHLVEYLRNLNSARRAGSTGSPVRVPW